MVQEYLEHHRHQIRFENRNCFTGALVLGNLVLLGSVPLEDMDLIITPRSQEVTINPDSPNIPSAVVMHLTSNLYYSHMILSLQKAK